MKSSELFKKLKQAGWQEISQNGSHIKMKHPTIPGVLIYPYHGSKEIPKGTEKAIKKQAGLK
ncbi:type II toxin-antitoxin system HicA family toxin [Pedobacter punctiformis]|uniref:Type II toxin-antitoxin system HicA family toxin n=1 Tax=Pedobacter punctiformis TaxID=3004097 RepID=A0ABT4LAK9_9SPHI|nr:type II toxin-antitoxin system HicA family toxin [Pedobacter sp. HCMS5-2]MCZ4244945.1 type II toxin-antitoxin system HicA family toxin [Pedobacter sp. HCMS5-2]